MTGLIRDGTTRDRTTRVEFWGGRHVGVIIRGRMQHLAGASLLVIGTLSAVALRDDTPVP